MYKYSNGQIALSEFKQRIGMNLNEVRDKCQDYCDQNERTEVERIFSPENSNADSAR